MENTHSSVRWQDRLLIITLVVVAFLIIFYGIYKIWKNEMSQKEQRSMQQSQFKSDSARIKQTRIAPLKNQTVDDDAKNPHVID